MRRSLLSCLFVTLVLSSAGAAAGVYEDLMNALAIDDRATVEALLKKGVDPDTVSPKGDPLVLIAVREGKLEVLKTVLAHRPKVNARNALGETALMHAAIRGRMDMVKLLLESGAAVNQPGWTPLIYAAAGNQPDIARLFIERGANVNAAAENGTTALMMAAREGHLPVVLLLMEKGADINHRSPFGWTALGVAESRNRKDVAEILIRAGAER